MTTAIVGSSETIIKTRMTAADREALAQRVAGAFSKLADHQAEVLQLWEEFENLPEDETIMDCATKTEYCTKVLGRSMRAVQYMLKGGNPRETISCGGIHTVCETCGEEFPSKGKYRKHINRKHPELLSTVQQPKALPIPQPIPQPTAPSPQAGVQMKGADFLKSIAPAAHAVESAAAKQIHICGDENAPLFWKTLGNKLNALLPAYSDGSEHTMTTLLEKARNEQLSDDPTVLKSIVVMLKKISSEYAQHAQKLEARMNFAEIKTDKIARVV